MASEWSCCTTCNCCTHHLRYTCDMHALSLTHEEPVVTNSLCIVQPRRGYVYLLICTKCSRTFPRLQAAAGEGHRGRVAGGVVKGTCTILCNFKRAVLPRLVTIIVVCLVVSVQLLYSSHILLMHCFHMLLKLGTVARDFGHWHRVPHNSSDGHLSWYWQAPWPVHNPHACLDVPTQP